MADDTDINFAENMQPMERDGFGAYTITDDTNINFAENVEPMERDGVGEYTIADDTNINFAENVQPMEIDGVGVTFVPEEEAIEQKITKRTEGIPDLPNDTVTCSHYDAKEAPQYQPEMQNASQRPANIRPICTHKEEGFIDVGPMGSFLTTTTKQCLRELDNWPTSGSHGCIVEPTCSPVDGHYAKDRHFDEETPFLNGKNKIVSHCVDKNTNEKFVRKQIVQNKWNKNEAIVPLNMSHNNIAKVLGVLQRDENDTLWMELLLENAGLSLAQYLPRNYPLSPNDLREVIIQGLAGLAYMHNHDIIHMDIKPQNICIEKKGDSLIIKLIDFGSAKLPHQDVKKIDWTPEYMPPESCAFYIQALKTTDLREAARNITTKVDVFAFAMVTCYLKTQKHPLMMLVTDDCEYPKGERDRLRWDLIYKMAMNGENYIKYVLDRIPCKDNLKQLLESMSSFSVEKRLSAEKALEIVQGLVNQSRTKKRQAIVSLEDESAVMVEASEGESCSNVKRARLRAIAPQFHPPKDVTGIFKSTPNMNNQQTVRRLSTELLEETAASVQASRCEPKQEIPVVVNEIDDSKRETDPEHERILKNLRGTLLERKALLNVSRTCLPIQGDEIANLIRQTEGVPADFGIPNDSPLTRHFDRDKTPSIQNVSHGDRTGVHQENEETKAKLPHFEMLFSSD